MPETKFLKIKLHLSGDVRTVEEGEANMLIRTKRASLVREEERETATKKVPVEKAVK
jgi:hypothetical protein